MSAPTSERPAVKRNILMVRIDPDLAKTLRLVAVLENTSAPVLVNETIRPVLDRLYRKHARRIAEENKHC